MTDVDLGLIYLTLAAVAITQIYIRVYKSSPEVYFTYVAFGYPFVALITGLSFLLMRLVGSHIATTDLGQLGQWVAFIVFGSLTGHLVSKIKWHNVGRHLGLGGLCGLGMFGGIGLTSESASDDATVLFALGVAIVAGIAYAIAAAISIYKPNFQSPDKENSIR